MLGEGVFIRERGWEKANLAVFWVNLCALTKDFT